MHPLFGAARSVLALGIGGGGDVVGALGVAEMATADGMTTRVGGVTWERRPIDPLPGPRRLEEITGLQRINAAAGLAGPDTRGPGGFLFAESNMARFLGEPTLLVDPHAGPAALAAGIDDAAEAMQCDLVALVDVGGDVLAHGDEPGLASPLCDAVLLAATAHMHTPTVGALFGAGCDGELTPDEVLERISEVAAAGGLIGSRGLTRPQLARLEGAVAAVPTEASAQAVRCGRGAFGHTSIRDGRRTVALSPVGAIVFFFEPLFAMTSTARLASTVIDTSSLAEAEQRLAGLGIRTELTYELEAAGRRP